MNQLSVYENKGVGQNVTPLSQENQQEFLIIEQVVLQGDLSKLTPKQRVLYYNKVCESCGLNPFTRPFDYIQMNGKLTLYSKKDCSEQLRKLNGVSIESLDDKFVDDLYIVKAKAKDKTGRLDESTGAVSIANLKGEAKANAIMKAETKAKRRVTLSISGLGWTDETEIETIPNAKKINVNLETGEIIDAKLCQVQVDTNLSQHTTTNLLPKPTETVEKPKMIEKHQWTELNKLIDECSRPFQQKIWDRLAALGIQSMEELDEETFVKMRDACLGNIAKHKKEEKNEVGQ